MTHYASNGAITITASEAELLAEHVEPFLEGDDHSYQLVGRLLRVLSRLAGEDTYWNIGDRVTWVDSAGVRLGGTVDDCSSAGYVRLVTDSGDAWSIPLDGQSKYKLRRERLTRSEVVINETETLENRQKAAPMFDADDYYFGKRKQQ